MQFRNPANGQVFDRPEDMKHSLLAQGFEVLEAPSEVVPRPVEAPAAEAASVEVAVEKPAAKKAVKKG